jgi:hypothetical protein
MLDHISSRDILTPIEIYTDSERFQSLASKFISLRIQIHTVKDAERAACNFVSSIVPPYRLSIHKITLSEPNNELPELGHLLQLKYWESCGKK